MRNLKEYPITIGEKITFLNRVEKWVDDEFGHLIGDISRAVLEEIRKDIWPPADSAGATPEPSPIQPRNPPFSRGLTDPYFGTSWIPWSGGDRPVSDSTIVEILLRQGSTLIGPAGHWVWKHKIGAGDIMFYREMK